MSATLKSESREAWHGEDVTMKDVLEALGGIRAKFARAEAGDSEHAHPRNCVMTLVALSASLTEEKRANEACRVIGSLHPATGIVIREEPGKHRRGLDAWITTDVQRPEMACAVECEVVTLHVPSAAADHVDALVDPLLVSGVPTYLWWMGTPPFGKHELVEALRICDAIVFDSSRFEEPYRAFHGLSRLIHVAHEKLGLADLQWSRLRPWRETIAQFFTPADRRGFLQGISEVGIDYAGERRGNRIAATLTTGWMASALGWRLQRATAGPGGTVSAVYAAHGRSVQVSLRSMPRDNLAAGELAAVRIAGMAHGTTFRLSVQREPERARPEPGEGHYRTLHPTAGDDDAGVELAERRAEWHRDVLRENLDSLHHSATGDPPGQSRPRHPVVLTRERRRGDVSQVLLTMIDIGDIPTLRHVQHVAQEDDATLLLDLLATGTHDHVFNRSLSAGFELMRKF